MLTPIDRSWRREGSMMLLSDILTYSGGNMSYGGHVAGSQATSYSF